MKDNPYNKLIQQMKKQGKSVNTPSIQIGRVVSASPLMIQIGDLQIDRANILIADYLLNGYSRDAVIDDMSGTLKLGPSLKANDRLAILPTSDKQTYIVLAKVVRP